LSAAVVAQGYLVYRLIFITLDIFYNDLTFLHKLKLLRASTSSGYYLNLRRRWLQMVESDKVAAGIILSGCGFARVTLNPKP